MSTSWVPLAWPRPPGPPEPPGPPGPGHGENVGESQVEMENHKFIDDVSMETFIYSGFPS